MERKVGEIFEHNGEWYQCVEGTGCYRCAFNDKNICIADNPHCTCRSDKKNVIFKKLEKVGEPFMCNYYGDSRLIMMQEYKAYNTYTIYTNNVPMYVTDKIHGRVAIELKQSKKDMEEKKLNLKEFDLEAAKAGKPVCTRDGRKVRIICFDRKLLFKGISYPIIALVEDTAKEEIIYGYNEKGKVMIEDDATYKDDLMMLPQKKEGWIIIHKEAIYDKETAEKIARETTANVIRIQNIEWEE